ncbi:MAG: IS30 family transposase [Candidatus Paceibacterota bacterium]
MKKRRPFKHLGQAERDRIHALWGNGYTKKNVADVLGVHKSTVSREIERYGRRTWRYNAGRAQGDAEEKRARSKRPGMKIAEHPPLRWHLIRELKKLRSPDEIAGRMRRDGIVPRVGKNAIYKWLYSTDGQPYCRYLCTRRTKKKRQSRLSPRVLIPERIPLKERPGAPHLVHAEGDLFVSPRTTTACGLVVVVTDTKLLAGSIVSRKTLAQVVPAMRRVTQSVAIDTCTLDNGIENIHHREFGVTAYFCDKGSPYQKPHIEGSIGLIRRWFLPKGTDLSTVPDDVFQSQLHVFNLKYRKSLGYRNAYEVSLERGIIDRIPRISLAKAVAFR